MLVLCDHAANRIPPEFNDLGLCAYERSRHIAWDIGAADVARRLARHLRAPAFTHGISRLVADPNRHFADPSLTPAVSDDTAIPGNTLIDDDERKRRWHRYHQPYHRRIVRHLNQQAALGCAPLLVSVHSFTPQLTGEAPRDCQAGVLWRDDPTFANPFIRELARDGTAVGNNRPYDGHQAIGYTVEVHAIARGLPYLAIELRQDLLGTPSARARWAAKLFRALLATRSQLLRP